MKRSLGGIIFLPETVALREVSGSVVGARTRGRRATYSRFSAPASRARAFDQRALGTAARGSRRARSAGVVGVAGAILGGITRRGASCKQRARMSWLGHSGWKPAGADHVGVFFVVCWWQRPRGRCTEAPGELKCQGTFRTSSREGERAFFSALLESLLWLLLDRRFIVSAEMERHRPPCTDGEQHAGSVVVRSLPLARRPLAAMGGR